MSGIERPLNLRTLEIFSTVVETGGMTLAAAKLGLTQSAVSQAIRSLEDTLQITLFDRAVRPPALTLVGHLVAKHAADVTEKVRSLEQDIRFNGGRRVPALRVGMIDSFAKAVGPKLLHRLDDLADQWIIMSGASETRLEAVLSRRLDMVITTIEDAVPPELFEIDIFSEPLFVIAPGNYTGGTSLKELSASLNFIRSGHNLHITPQIEQYLNQHGVVPAKTYEMNSVDAAISMVEEGLGWTMGFPLGVLNSTFFRSQERSVLCLPLPNPPLMRRVRLVGHAANGLAIGGKIASTARDIVREQLRSRLPDALQWLSDSVVFPLTKDDDGPKS